MQRNEIYPQDWPTIAYAIKEACAWRCSICNKQCRRPGELNLGWEYVLTVAHITQEYDADVVQVQPLCIPCHLRHDAPLSWWARRRHMHIRRRLAGQLQLAY